MYSCRYHCRIDYVKMAMLNIIPSVAYMVANRCTICSDINTSVWYLKWVKSCPCCGSSLRRKSKHSEGRRKVTEHIKRIR